MEFLDTGFKVTKKGTIDLVTEADVAVEKMFRAMIAERFPGSHHPGGGIRRRIRTRKGASHCWVFDPIDGTNNYAHGLPIFCSSLALEIDGKGDDRRDLRSDAQGTVRRRARRRSVPERPSRFTCRTRPTLVESMLVTGFPYDIHKRIPEIVGLFGEFVGKARAVRRLGSAALDLCYVAAGRMDGFWEQDLKPWDVAGRHDHRRGGGREGDRLRRRSPSCIAHGHQRRSATNGKDPRGAC